MKQLSLARFWSKLRQHGIRAGLRRSLYRCTEPVANAPLKNIDPFFLFNTNLYEAEEAEKRDLKSSTYLTSASSLEKDYPEVLEFEGRFLRYKFIHAIEAPKGLIVLFHGHGGNNSPNPVLDFDILAPWDTYGYRRLGSWFWGERGDNFVDRLVHELIKKYLDMYARPWFTYGGSMGGFAALWHGIKYDSSGIYATAPQVDLRRKIQDYGDTKNPYTELMGQSSGDFPDLYKLAESKEELPPLFLVQCQYDAVNDFANHALPLVQIFQNKKAWLGLRIYPAVGHKSHDGSLEEALVFFRQIVEKAPAKKPKFIRQTNTTI